MNVIKNDQRRLVTDFTDFEAPLVVGLELAPSQVPTPRFLCAGLFLGRLKIFLLGHLKMSYQNVGRRSIARAARASQLEHKTFDEIIAN